jgi:hypothetical protein
MAKKGSFTFDEQWLKTKGFVEVEKGTFSKSKGKDIVKNDVSAPKIGKMVEVASQTFISANISICKPLDSVLVISGLIPGLNGDKGLIRAHWANLKKQKDLYCLIIGDHIRENKMREHEGKVTIQYIGYKSLLSDWDNFGASFKNLGDSLVKMKIIKDDNPSIVTQFIPQQIKCKRSEQKVVIIIKDFHSCTVQNH